MRTWLSRGTCLVAAAALLAAGCGDDSNNSAATTTSAPGAADTTTTSAAPEPTGEPIKILISFPDEGAPISLGEQRDGAKAAVESINDAGGLQGRPLELVECDHHFNPNDATACARQAVDDTSIVAAVGSQWVFTDSVVPILVDGQVPDIGPYPSGRPDHFNSDVSFIGIGGSFAASLGMVQAALQDGATKIAILRSDVDNALPLVQAIQGSATQAGIEAVDVPVPEGTTDVAPQVATALDANPSHVILLFGEPSLSRVIKELKASGFEGRILCTAGQLDVDGLGADGDGVTALFAFPPLNADSDVPGVESYLADMAKYEPDAKVNEISTTGWFAVKMFADVASGLTTIDRQSLLDAFHALSNYDTRGLTGPLDFSQPGPMPGFPGFVNTHAWVEQLEGGKWQLVYPDQISVLG